MTVKSTPDTLTWNIKSATEAGKRFLSTRRNPINIKEKDGNRHG